MTHTGDRRSLRLAKDKRRSHTQRLRYNRLKAAGLCPVCGLVKVQGRVVCMFCVDSTNSRRDHGRHIPSSYFRIYSQE